MAAPIDFYFDFSSPYGYLAGELIDTLAARYQRSVRWRPILLGVVFKTTGGAPLPSLPLKGDYSRRDFARSARFHDIAYRHPARFPISTVAPARAFYWLDGQDAMAAIHLAKLLFRAYFADGLDISDPETTVAVATQAPLGLSADAIREGMSLPAVKDRVRTEVEQALAIGVFGSPYMVIDGEPFWGADRLDQMERWLARGPW